MADTDTAARVAEQTSIRRALLRGGYTPLANRRPHLPMRQFRIVGDVCVVALTQGYETVVDLEDARFVLSYRWHASVRKNRAYAARNPLKSLGETKNRYLHRVLMRAPSKQVVDHIDGDPLNNRKQNLRLGTQMQNTWNATAHSDNTSGYKGVYRSNVPGKWISKILVAGKLHKLGQFDTKEAAAVAYAEASLRLHGDFCSATVLHLHLENAE